MRWSKEHSDKEKGTQHKNLRIPVFKSWVEKGQLEPDQLSQNTDFSTTTYKDLHGLSAHFSTFLLH